MKTRNKKGFTIVELVIVIAVIGILTAILVPVFINLTNKANRASDDSLVKNLNTAMSMEEGEGKTNSTYNDAIQYLDNYGFKLENLATKSEYSLLWNSKTNRFLLNEESALHKDQIETGAADHQYWTIKNNIPEENSFSIYAGLGWDDTAAVVLTGIGFDAGNHNPASVSYSNSESVKNVTLRTNSATTSLTINDTTESTIKHYGAAGALNIIQCHTESYHENGKVAYAEIATGRIVLESGSKVEEIHVNKKTDSSFDTVIIANNGGEEELPQRITRDAVTVSKETLVVKVESNGASENVYVYADGVTGTKGSTQKVVDEENPENNQNANVNSALGQLVLDNGASSDKAQTAEEKQEAKQEVVEEAKSEEIIDRGEAEGKNYIARIGMVGYESLKDALAAANNNETIYLVSDDDSEEQLSLSKPIILNMSGNTYAGNLRLAYDGVTVNGEANVTNSAASLTIDKNTIYYGLYQSAYNKANSLLTGGIIAANESASRVTLKLLADFKVPGPANYGAMSFDVPMTLDLNGHTLEFGTTSSCFQMKDNFVLKDSSAEKNGVLLASRTTNAAIKLGTESQSATFTLESGTIQSEVELFYTYDNCTIDVKGGHLISFSKYGTGDSRGIFKKLSNGCTFTMSGGEYRSDQSAKSWDTMSFDPMGYPVKNVNANSTIAVTGGSFSGQAIQRYVPGYVSDQSFSNTNPTIIVGNYQITRTTISSPYGAAPYDVYLYTVEALQN